MFWFLFLILFIAAAAYLLVKFDKKYKEKYNNDTGVPKAWTVPELAETPIEKIATAAIAVVSYGKNESLFSPAEKSFFSVLSTALEDEYHIFAKVRVADVVNVKSIADRSAWQIAFNKISAKHFDFVICRKADLAIACVIELDDKSHQQDDRVERDRLLENVCQAAQLPLVRFPVKSSYVLTVVRAQILQSIGVVEQVPLQHSYAAEIVPTNKTKDVLTATGEQPIIKLCPKCASVMVKRTAKSGTHEGKLFWACSTYPKCRGIVSITEEASVE